MPDLPKVTQEFDANNGPFLASLQAMIDQTQRLIDQVNTLHAAIDSLPDVKNIEVNVTGNAADAINAIHADLDALPGSKVIEVTTVYRSTGDLPDIPGVSDVTQTVNIDQQISDIGDVNAQLRDQLNLLNEDANAARESSAALDGLKSSEDDLAAAVNDTEGSFRAQYNAVQAAVDAENILRNSSSVLADAQRALDGETVALTDSLGGDGGGSGLAAAAAAAGGPRGIGFLAFALTGSIGPIALWHLALDLAIESALAVGLASAAAGVAIAGMAPAAQDIYNHLVSVHDVSVALGQSIPPLNSWFENLQHAMAPGVVEIYGAALNALNSTALGPLGGTAEKVEKLFEDWAAKIDIWLQTNNNWGKMLGSGIGFLQQFGVIFADLAKAIDNLVVKDPGTAHFLLDIVEGAAKLLDVVTNLPAPILETALAIHAWYVYGGTALGLLTKFVPELKGLAGVISGMSGPTLFVLAAVATGVFELARAWGTASPEVQTDINNVMSSINSMTPAQAIMGGIAEGIGKLNTDIQSVNVSSVESQWKGLNGIWQETGDYFVALGRDIKGMFTGGVMDQLKAGADLIKNIFGQGSGEQAAAAVQVQNDINSLKDAINQLLGSYRNLDDETGNLIKQGYTYNQALALMSLAGVQASDSFDVMQQKVKNLITGYTDMSISGGILNNTVNAITFSTELQNSKVSAVNQGWDTFIGMITGGESGLLGFAGAMNTLGSDMKNVQGSFTGLNQGSVQLQNDFQGGVTAANSQMDSLTTLAAAAGLGSKGTTLLANATKDMVAQMLPAAQTSPVLTTELYALAQRGGYTGADSFQQLAKWVGNTKSPMQDLQGVVTTLTEKAGNLATDVHNLADAINSDLNQAMAQAIILASGGEAPFENFAKAVLTTGANSGQTTSSAIALGKQIIAITGSASDAQPIFESFAMGALHLTKTQADDLWQDIENNVNPSLGKNLPDSVHQASRALDDMKDNHISPAQQAIDTIKDHTDTFGSHLTPGLTDAIGTTGQRVDEWKDGHISPAQQAVDTIKAHTDVFGQALHPNLTGNIDEAGSHSDNLKTQHLSPLQTFINTMDGFVKDLERDFGHWPSSESTNVKVSGSGKATIKASGGGGLGIASTTLTLAAGGGVIPGYDPGHDSIPAMLSPGEGVLIPQAVKAMGGASAISALNSHAKRFADGGVAYPKSVTDFYPTAADILSTWTTDVTHAYGNVINQVIKNITTQFNQMGSGPLGGATGSEMQNGVELYNYLLANVFRGNRIAAAGATASIWGESNWDPFAVGTGGRGLIGWTPEGTISNAAFSGGMATQLPAIIQFINSSGDWGVIAQMMRATSVIQAAYEWGQGVERYGIPDVHPEGVALATAIMNGAGSAGATAAGNAIGKASQTHDAGGWLYPGLNMVWNGTGGIERTVGPREAGQGGVLHNVIMLDGQKLFDSMKPYSYREAAWNNGNSNSNAYWAPGNVRSHG